MTIIQVLVGVSLIFISLYDMQTRAQENAAKGVTLEDKVLMESLREHSRSLTKKDLKTDVPNQKRLDYASRKYQQDINEILKSVEKSFDISGAGVQIFDDKSMEELARKGHKERAKAEEQKSQSNFDLLTFISFGMDKETVKELYRANQDNPRVALVIRGLIKGTKNINETIYQIQKIAADLHMEKPPAVLINPTWFEQYHVTSVPTIVALRNAAPTRSGDFQTGKEVAATEEYARVEGLIAPEWLVKQIELGKRGDLGIMGPVQDIEERDLIEELKERAAKVDWEGKKQDAMARVWLNQPIEKLSPAEEYTMRVLNPTFTVKQDITAPNPRKPDETLYIAHKGTRINPLDIHPFPPLMVFFDPTRKGEMDYVANHLDEWSVKYGKSFGNIVLTMTDIDRQRGWEAYHEMESRFNKHIYALMPEVKQSFALEHTPCIVYQSGNRFVVEEFDIRGTTPADDIRERSRTEENVEMSLQTPLFE